MYQYVDDVLHKTLLMIHYIFAPIETLKYLLNSKLLLLVFLFLFRDVFFDKDQCPCPQTIVCWLFCSVLDKYCLFAQKIIVQLKETGWVAETLQSLLLKYFMGIFVMEEDYSWHIQSFAVVDVEVFGWVMKAMRPHAALKREHRPRLWDQLDLNASSHAVPMSQM